MLSEAMERLCNTCTLAKTSLTGDWCEGMKKFIPWMDRVNDCSWRKESINNTPKQ